MATRVNSLFIQMVQSTDVSSYVKPENPSTNLVPIIEANWVDNPSMTSSWLTDIGRGQSTGLEDRRSRRARPRRALAYQITGFDGLSKDREPNYGSKILSSIFGLSKGPIPVPIVMDRVKVTEDYTAEDSRIYGDFRYRRFFEGQNIAVVIDPFNRPDLDGLLVDYLPATITSIAGAYSGYIEISGIGQDIPKGARIYPLMDSNFLSSATLRRITNSILDGDLEFNEVGSAATLPPSNVLPLVSEFKVNPYDGNPIFDVKLTGEISLLINRSGQFVTVGNGGIETLVGDRPKFGYSATIIWKERKEFFRLLQWFDRSKGRNKTFWFRNPFKLFNLVDVPNNNSIVIKPLGYRFNLKEHWPFICILFTSGNEQFRKIDTVTQAANGNYLITTEDSFASGAVKLVSSGHLGRFNSDAFTETWVTDEQGSAPIEVTEILDEEDLFF